MSKNDEQLEVINEIFTRADAQNLPLWLDGGWAIDAQLNKINREHEDIDVVFPEDRRDEYVAIIHDLGFNVTERMDYGFLSKRGEQLLDSEICKKIGDHYEIAGFPKNACSESKSGVIAGIPVRCISWDKMYFEFLFLKEEVPRNNWKPKHFTSLEIIESHLDSARKSELVEMFAKREK